ncbi:segregation/condensation protein A [Schaalia georgiae]|nr:segregation/condensation protein A [Schaalia georgiae]
MAEPPEADGTAPEGDREGRFQVRLDVFEGPFDLLLQLIARKRLDISEVALARVTDEFIAHMRAFPDLSRATEFLVVAATLLDMKAAHLLPRLDDGPDAAAEDLEARDLLFSRLLQYRAFKTVAAQVAARLERFGAYTPRAAPLEARFAALLPELVWTTTPGELARMAVDALTRTEPAVEVAHLHDPAVPVAEQARIVAECLSAQGAATFESLVADAATRAVVVARFLALLELYRRGAVDFAQDQPLGDLTMVWTGGGDACAGIDDPYEGSAGGGPAGGGAAAVPGGETTTGDVTMASGETAPPTKTALDEEDGRRRRGGR